MALSAQVTVPAAGTAVQFADQLIDSGLLIKALPGNTGIMYIGNTGSNVTTTTGMPLSAGNTLTLDHIGNMSELYLNATVSGEGIAWLAMGV